jgi:hypothetical protein
MFIKYLFLLVIIVSPFLSVQSTARGTENDTIIETLKSKPVSLQNTPDLIWKPCTSPFLELLGKGFLSLNVDFRRKESYAISIGFQPMEGLMPDIMYYHFSGNLHRFEVGGGLSGGFNNKFDLAGVLIHGVVGYRYQKKDGLFFRAGFTPFYVIFILDKERSNKLIPSLGLSLGYSFKHSSLEPC